MKHGLDGKSSRAALRQMRFFKGYSDYNSCI